jgi:hypothetical protein
MATPRTEVDLELGTQLMPQLFLAYYFRFITHLRQYLINNPSWRVGATSNTGALDVGEAVMTIVSQGGEFGDGRDDELKKILISRVSSFTTFSTSPTSTKSTTSSSSRRTIRLKLGGASIF